MVMMALMRLLFDFFMGAAVAPVPGRFAQEVTWGWLVVAAGAGECSTFLTPSFVGAAATGAAAGAVGTVRLVLQTGQGMFMPALLVSQTIDCPHFGQGNLKSLMFYKNMRVNPLKSHAVHKHQLWEMGYQVVPP
jgi:hypothetical protein